MIKTELNDASGVEGQITTEIWPQGFAFSNEPVLQSLDLRGVTNREEAMMLIQAHFHSHGFSDDELIIEVRGAMNRFLGEIISITIKPWLERK